MDLPLKKGKDRVTLEVRVQPRASRAEISGVEGEVLKIRLTAPPADGEANKQLIALLSKVLKVAKSNIRIKRGETARLKLIQVFLAQKN